MMNYEVRIDLSNLEDLTNLRLKKFVEFVFKSRMKLKTYFYQQIITYENNTKRNSHI
jgi:hypothetical protein